MKTLSSASPARGSIATIARRIVRLVATLPIAAATFTQAQDVTDVEQVVVVGERVYPVVDTLAPATADAVDTAELLRQLPGANLNANGMLTGIAQYRGLYGDRVAVSIDGLRTTTGGPNAMDAPLSYASPLLIARLSLERGIPSVSSATESLGGHIDADHDRGEHRDRHEFALAGKAEGRYGTNGGLNSSALQLAGANDTHKIALLAQHDAADDFEYPGGKLVPTRLDRDRYDLSYAYRNDGVRTLVYAGRLDTADTGTPSLPMDIRSIEADMSGLRVETDLGARSKLTFLLSTSNIDHVMDNFGLRTPPASPMSFRSTHATGDGKQWRIGWRTLMDSGSWQLGLDSESAEHTATITNPNVGAFRIDNFNRATRDITGLYGQWNRSLAALDLEAGLRLNRVRISAGPVAASIPPLNSQMQMMAANIALLANGFNGSERAGTHDNVDAVFKIGRTISDSRNVYLELGRKTRAPSYQELYLWLPLEATGGLADGRSYIGNPFLESEVSQEINLGSNWQGMKTWLAPQLFFKHIAGYIQGVPSTSATANMIATMMTGLPALEFTNTTAEIYGVDLGWGHYLSDMLTLDGVLTYVRGRRTDVKDDLYRLAPLNGRIGLTYEKNNWLARIESVLYARQDRVSAYNDERTTSGYAIVNVAMRWRLASGVQLSANVANVLDKRYQDHLDGINRVAAVDVPIGERLFGLGRNLQVGVRFDW